MTKMHSVTGRMSDKPREVGHLRIFSTSDEPKSWAVESHESLEGDKRPEERNFTDGKELLRHVAEQIGIPQEEDAERKAREYPDFELPKDKR
jgi:hypothetical protein